MAQMVSQPKKLEVSGSLLMGYAMTCINLNIIAGMRAREITSNIEPDKWYDFDRVLKIHELVQESYSKSTTILETVGAAMMSAWYHHGPGKEIISDGVGFLHFQAGSEGYASVVRGPEEEVGHFELRELDVEKGYALIHSTTAFEEAVGRGVIVGGMSSPGDIEYIRVEGGYDDPFIHVYFHICPPEISKKLDQFLQLENPAEMQLTPEEIQELWWKIKARELNLERKDAFWGATNENLSAAYEKLDEQSRYLADMYHKAGMADAAADFLHNIRNVINSLSVSSSLIIERMQRSKIQNLLKANEILEKNLDNAGEFFTNDSKGKQLPKYYITLGNSIQKEKEDLSQELNRIQKGVSNIDQVVSALSAYSDKNIASEELNLIEIIEDALQVQETVLAENNVSIKKEYSENNILSIRARKSRLIGVFVELFKNAIEAMNTQPDKPPVITIGAERFPDKVVATITDNGPGVPDDDLKNVFTQGYTTKEERFGFGLHNCANHMGEMGGRLDIEKRGDNSGLTCVLQLNT